MKKCDSADSFLSSQGRILSADKEKLLFMAGIWFYIATHNVD